MMVSQRQLVSAPAVLSYIKTTYVFVESRGLASFRCRTNAAVSTSTSVMPRLVTMVTLHLENPNPLSFFISTEFFQTQVTVRSLLPVHERGTAYHLTFEHLHNHSTLLRNILNPTSFNCLSLACRACDYVYIDYVRRSRSSLCRLLHSINCQTYITLHWQIFTKFNELTDSDKIMNPQHFWSDPADISNRIYPEIPIRILDHFWLTFWPWWSLRYVCISFLVPGNILCAD